MRSVGIPLRRRVGVLSLLDGGDAGLFDRLRNIEVGLADRKVNRVLQRCGKVEDFANAAGVKSRSSLGNHEDDEEAATRLCLGAVRRGLSNLMLSETVATEHYSGKENVRSQGRAEKGDGLRVTLNQTAKDCSHLICGSSQEPKLLIRKNASEPAKTVGTATSIESRRRIKCPIPIIAANPA